MVPAHSTSIIGCTYCVLAWPPSTPVYFVPLSQLETSRGLFKKVIGLSCLKGKTWLWESEDFHIGGCRGVTGGKGAEDPACWVCIASMLFYEDFLPLWGDMALLVMKERAKTPNPPRHHPWGQAQGKHLSTKFQAQQLLKFKVAIS